MALACACVSCQEVARHPNGDLSLEAYDSLREEAYTLHPTKVRDHIRHLAARAKGQHSEDAYICDYYSAGTFLWVDRLGVDDRADSVLKYVEAVSEMGFSPSKFNAAQISRDLERVLNLDFDSLENAIDKVYARLELNLTKAYLHYARGQHFGFVNPAPAMNRLDVREQDSTHVAYRTLFDVPLLHADGKFYDEAIGKVRGDSVGAFLASLQPEGELYARLGGRLAEAHGEAERMRILCNMERCRWRPKGGLGGKKYVQVNIPSFRLFAYGGDSVMSMRVCCGALSTKTPLLASSIYRMDVNPQWIIPKSIVEKDIARHAGNTGYFDRHRYFVSDRRTGKRVPISEVSHSMLCNRNYLVVQEGGAGNSLGRIIFRFNNNFSVFLHDTSTPGVFQRDNRAVSHGCVRLERPFDMAVFLLQGMDDGKVERVRKSMGLGDSGERRQETSSPRPASWSIAVTPEIPVFITYYTIFPDEHGQLQTYADVYGYDSVLSNQLRSYANGL